ncbi:uncharacterized protein K452DRAFT_228234 [Aplosporella prunicola CBS 121167]|uniref:LisH domain-containing protein n=1 Tax=Aplosporella prunicola CBS 121167 TaxID=1176127 RepID=A0A6A6BBV1_9PEZI|nr:uncharacterized protein K452DRAFT_228234 [Aplosporella prunicola CBS 121167]KAF2141679.1 hypothetical protein K452DRAFT_228234 [Aplosporella prunicola CBS 121167]
MASPAVLVARFLRANNYSQTLDAFLAEANLPSDAGAVTNGDLTVEQLLREKQAFDLSANFERLGVQDDDKGWHDPAPSSATELTLPTTSNLLNASVEIIARGVEAEPFILATTADRHLHLISSRASSFEIHRSISHIQDSPILSYNVICQRYLLASSMSGKLLLYDCGSDTLLNERKDHAKYLVKIASIEDDEGAWIATAGWDAKVHLYRLNVRQDSPIHLKAPVANLTLPTNPEALLFVRHPVTEKPLLLLTRRDSTFLFYYSLPEPGAGCSEGAPVTLELLGKQNLAPTSTAWVAFTPSSIALCPTDSSLLAVATSAVPHMKLLIVRLLLPPADAVDAGSERSIGLEEAPIAQDSVRDGINFSAMTQASQARAALIVQERELAAILIQCSTLAPQTPYSTPSLAWRPDGTGVWVNSDDGVVRGVEASTGKVVASLKGHDAASKIRCIWAGRVGSGENGGEEWMISGGFDQKLILWRTQQAVESA